MNDSSRDEIPSTLVALYEAERPLPDVPAAQRARIDGRLRRALRASAPSRAGAKTA